MKDNKGVTLTVLLVVVIILLILTSMATFTGKNSIEIVRIQNYKAQMQVIQNEVDEIYEEYKSYCLRNSMEFDFSNISSYMNEKYNTQMEELETDDEWLDKQNYGIEDTENYYKISKIYLEKICNIDKLDISDNFIINFKKRYVFSETPLTVKNQDGNNQDIYSLYEIDDEERIVEFNLENEITNGKIKYKILKTMKEYQTIEMTLEEAYDLKIKDVIYIDEEKNETSIKDKVDLFENIDGLKTNKVKFNVKKSGTYKFKINDFITDQKYTKELVVLLYEPPILEENMIPINIQNEEDIMKCTNLDEQWYNYNDLENINFATTLIDGINRENYDAVIELQTEDTVKVWIPKSLYEQINEKYETEILEEDLINKTGIWIDAKWDTENNKFIPKIEE